MTTRKKTVEASIDTDTPHTKIAYISVGLDKTHLIFVVNYETTLHFLPLFTNERYVKSDELNLLAANRNSDRGQVPRIFLDPKTEWYSNIRAGSPTYKNLLYRFSQGASIEYLEPPFTPEEIEFAKRDLRTLILENNITFHYGGDRTQLLGMIRDDVKGGRYQEYLQILGFIFNISNSANYDFSEVGSNYDEEVFIPYSQRGTPIRRY